MFSEDLIFAEVRLFLGCLGMTTTRVQYLPALRSLDLQVPLDGRIFALASFPSRCDRTTCKPVYFPFRNSITVDKHNEWLLASPGQ